MLENLRHKKILVGVTGGIAAYKACELVRIFKKQGANVKVIMTASAMEFVQPLTFRTLSGHKVYHKQFEQELENEDVEHISLARWANCVVISPATANCIAKIAAGIADDLLSTVLLATTAPIILAPAMNKEMWRNAATQTNILTLRERGINIIGPANGFQACGETGAGRMIEPLEIAEFTAALFFPQILAETKIVITAGPTIEPIDPVRYLTNRSSGKMGYAIASAAKELGAQVVLISGPTHLTPPCGVHTINVTTAIDMQNAVMCEIENCNIFVAVAAVADYRIENPAAEKIKKTEDRMMLSLVKNPDILATVSALENPPITVGFAAETNNVVEYAKEKLVRKNLDIVAANQVGETLAFGQAENSLAILTKNREEIITLTPKNKTLLARELMQIICEYRSNHSPALGVASTSQQTAHDPRVFS